MSTQPAIDFEMELLSGEDVSICVLDVYPLIPGQQKEGVRFIGEAKRHPKDKPDAAIGNALAMARTFFKASLFFADNAEQWMKENK